MAQQPLAYLYPEFLESDEARPIRILAEYLEPLREAHETVGRAVMLAIERDVELNDMSLADLKCFSALIEPDVFESLSLERTLATKSQTGGTSLDRVAAELTSARTRL